MLYLIAVCCIAAVVSYTITNFVGILAPQWGLVDKPDGHHKSHKREVALGGGLAVFLAASITFAVEFFSSPRLQKLLDTQEPFLGGLLLACGWIVLLGLWDDRFGMKGRYKLVGQFIATLIVIGSGLQIESFVVFDQKISLGVFSIPFTVFWLLGAINSLNLLDGIDGLATTIGIILCSTISVIAAAFGQPAVAIVAAVFVGSLLGFLPFNFPPARMFLGDAGSMLIGLVVGSLAIGGSMKGPATVGMAAPLAIWALPIFDSVAAIMRRKLSGRSIYATDRGHLHHRLMTVFGKNTRVLAVVAVCCAVTCAGALISTFMKNDLAALLSIAAVLCILVVTQVFGHIELVMLISRTKSAMLSLFRFGGDRQYAFRLQGSRDWNLMWQSMIEYAEKLDLIEVKLDVNIAAMQEGFHASWRRPSHSEKAQRWGAEVPLFSGEHVIGRLSVWGNRPIGMSSCETVNQLMEILEPLETEIVALATFNSPVEILPNGDSAAETREKASACIVAKSDTTVLERGCVADIPRYAARD
jgi:UDP-GlcNAc:undecaprenyl-phosphate/decaprenyl-phosphate GlcNAc-1-phosphate transferase